MTGTPAAMLRPGVCVTILAHQEERRIATCLASLPLDVADHVFHIVVNGSRDRTAAIARDMAGGRPNVTVHDWAEGGKSRSWNRLLFDTLDGFWETHAFVDGDAQVVPGSLDALRDTLAADPALNAAAGMPVNGRKVEAYRADMRRTHGLFGDLYAVRGRFMVRMRDAGVRLPVDLIGDDGLVAALAKTDLGPLSQWDDARVATCEAAGFRCEPVALTSPASWRLQYRRMINYSVRHFQNRIITGILTDPGPTGLPPRLAERYAAALPAMRPRVGLPWGWFDRLALQRMAAAATA